MNASNFSEHHTQHTLFKQPLHLMIVDDHEIVRQGLREVINSIPGFLVVAEASTCRDALLRIQNTPVDLIFIDLTLPDGNGMELIHILRRQSAPPHIVVLSAMINDDLLLETMLAGASGYLTKDISATEIERLLRGFRQGALILTPIIASRLIKLLVQKCLSLELSQIAEQRETNTPAPAKQSLQYVHSTAPQQEKEGSPLSHLTFQEDKIFHLLRLGLSNKQIASELSISRFTVGKHVQNILRKLGVTNRTQAASYTAFEGGKNDRYIEL